MTPRTALLLKWICYILLVAATTVHGLRSRPNRYGDGLEYALMMEGWLRHGSPHLEATDVPPYMALKDSSRMNYQAIGWPVGGYFPSNVEGRSICWHFGAYSLSAVPYRLLMPLIDRHPFQAFQLINCAWFMLGVGAVLFFWPGGNPIRWWAMLLGSLFNPCVWYLNFTGPEVMTWACLTCGLVAYRRQWFTAAVSFAVVASWQNSPAALVALAFLVLSWKRRSWGVALRTALAGVWVLLPSVYWYATTGVPNLIAAEGVQLQGLPGLGRTWGMLADANQGLLVYQPWLVLLFPIGVAIGLQSQFRESLALLLALAGMMLLAQKATNWNSACLGLMRYMLWMMPLVLWFTAIALARWPKLGRVLLVLLALSHATILFMAWPTIEDYTRPTPVAEWIWTNAPGLDNPDPQVFHSRVRRADALFDIRFTPIDYVPDAESGAVTKLLLHRDTLAKAAEQFTISPEYATLIEAEAAKHEGVFYMHPPPGAVVRKR